MRSMTRTASFELFLALTLICAGASTLKGQGASAPSTVVPPIIKFSGMMPLPGAQNRAGSNIPSSIVTATFSLYEFQEGGNPLWSETQKVQLDEQGRYVVLFGATSPTGLPIELFTSGKALWLGVQPQLSGAGELPRVVLVAVPYALKASDSDTLGGKPASAYALAGAPAVVELTGITASANPAVPNAVKAEMVQPLSACATITSDGTAAANEIAKFTTACNIEKSLLRDTGTAVAVGGTATPGAFLDVQFTSTATTGTLLGQRVLATLNPAATSTASANGLFSNTVTASGNKESFNSPIYATNSEVDHHGTGTLGFGYGLNGTVLNRSTGTIANAYGLSVALSNLAKGKITSGYGVYVAAPANSGGGTFTNFTGVYISSPTAVAGAYGLYSAGGKNYFAGDVGIGTTTPGANLEVNGTTKFDGLVTFKSGQTFPGVGGGTVTSVATGVGLTGGPITTSGTVSLAKADCSFGEALVALPFVCMAFATLDGNTFVGNQTINGSLTATGTISGNGAGLTKLDAAQLLDGILVQPNVTDSSSGTAYVSANVLAGYGVGTTATGANTITTGVTGATIAGGGSPSYPNSVTDDWGTVGGGYGNVAGNSTGTTSDALFATVAGGSSNTASGWTATVAGAPTTRPPPMAPRSAGVGQTAPAAAAMAMPRWPGAGPIPPTPTMPRSPEAP
jgi:hypothetical protein